MTVWGRRVKKKGVLNTERIVGTDEDVWCLARGMEEPTQFVFSLPLLGKMRNEKR